MFSRARPILYLDIGLDTNWGQCFQSVVQFFFRYFGVSVYTYKYMGRGMGFPTMWYVRPENLRSSCAYAQSDQSLCSSLKYSMSVKLLIEHLLEFLSLKGPSESTLVKMPHCWKAHVTTIIVLCYCKYVQCYLFVF